FASPARSFEILHLLAHLLDQHLQLDAHARQRLVLHLRRKRVRFAVQLLYHEVEAPSHGLVPPQDRLHFRDVANDAVDLLGNVGALRDERELLLQALGIPLHVEPLQALAQPLAVAQHHAVELRPDAGHQRRDRRIALLEHLGDACALAPGNTARTSPSSAFSRSSAPATIVPATAARSSAPIFSEQSTFPRLIATPTSSRHSGSTARRSSGNLKPSSRNRWLTLRISQTSRNNPTRASAVENPVML